VEGFGGAEVVLDQIQAAIADDDLRWALELASWLRTADPDQARFRLVTADILRRVGQRTTAANIRNWCLTAARDLDGTRPQDRHRTHRLRPQQVAGLAPVETVRILSVMLDPARAVGVDAHVAWVVDGTTPVGSHVRNGILCVTDGPGAHTTVELSRQRWVDLMCGSSSWDDTVAAGEVQVDGDPAVVVRVLACIDLTGTVG
jgi:alkyl sulfatase BDS1-like metallo-beta-lactamase superfamily hydrolase